MKSITAAVYGIRKMAIDEPEEYLFDSDRVKDRYNVMLNIALPTVLEDKSTKSHHPFDSQGNGNVGYQIYNIVKLNESTTIYQLFTTTEPINQMEQVQHRVPVFYIYSNKVRTAVSSINSTCHTCNRLKLTPADTTMMTSTIKTSTSTSIQLPTSTTAFLGTILAAIILTFFAISE